MYTLRTIHKGGLEVNTSLGEQYFIADCHRNGGSDFRDMYRNYYDDPNGEPQKDWVFDPDVIAMIRDSKGNLNCIWRTCDNYIMTESGSTFSRINRAEHE